MTKWKKLTKILNKGEILFKEGDIARGAYVVKTGLISLKRVKDGSYILVDEAKKGDIIGVPSTLTNSPRLYTAFVEEDDTKVVELPPQILNEIILKDPEISFFLLKKYSERILAVENLFKNIRLPKIDTDKLEKEEKSELPSHIRAYLKIIPSNRRVPIKKIKNTIGRKVLSMNYTPDIDLSAEDKGKYISRKHAVIFFDQNEFFVKEELGVLNGTFLNGEKLRENIPYKLKNGDIIKFCNIEAIFELER